MNRTLVKKAIFLIPMFAISLIFTIGVANVATAQHLQGEISVFCYLDNNDENGMFDTPGEYSTIDKLSVCYSMEGNWRVDRERTEYIYEKGLQ